MVWDKTFDLFSPNLSSQRSQRLSDLELQLQQFPWLQDENVQVLVIPNDIQFVHAKADSAMGLVGIKDMFLDDERFNQLALSLTYHERTHVQVASDLRQAFLTKHLDLDTFFHRIIIPEWLNGVVELETDEDYLRHKKWDGLYAGWAGPSFVELEKAIQAVDNFFALVKKGLIKLKGGTIQHHPSPRFPDRWTKIMQWHEQDLAEQYRQNPRDLAKAFVTGYKLMEYFEEAYRAALDYKHRMNLWLREEAFATFLGSELSGLSIDELNRWAPQDADKIYLATKIKGLNPFPIPVLLQQVRSYEGLVNFYKRLGLNPHN